MLTDDELADLRADTTDYLVDTCTINEPGARPTFANGTYTVTPGAEVYDGPCALAPTGGERVVIVGGEPVTLRTYTLRLPHDMTDLAVNQVVTMTASNDEAVIDKQLLVLDPQSRTNVLGRVAIVEDNLG